MNDVIFEAGDVVTCSFYGDEEFVLFGEDLGDYPINLNRKHKVTSFTSDGRFSVFHTSPILKLVRKKQKEREWIQVFRVACKNESFQLIKEFDSYEDAFWWIKKSGIPSWEYQIEKFYKVKE